MPLSYPAPGSRSPRPSISHLFPDFTAARYRHRTAQERRRLIAEFRDAYVRRGVVLYVGSGVSRSLGLPSWPELIRALTITMMTDKVESAIEGLSALDEHDKELTLFAMQTTVDKQSYATRPVLMMARAIKDELRNGFGEELARALYGCIYEDMPHVLHASFSMKKRAFRRRFLERASSLTSPLLESLVTLARPRDRVAGVHAIVNYNFDDLLERRLCAEKITCKIIRSGDDTVPLGTLPSYHVHGLIRVESCARRRPRPEGNLVFSEDEYHAEYSDPRRWSNVTQVRNLSRHTGLFVGLSLEDPNIRRLLDVTHRQYPRAVSYAILPRQRAPDHTRRVFRNLFESVEASSFEKIGIRVIWVDSHEEVGDVILRVAESAGSNNRLERSGSTPAAQPDRSAREK